MQIEKSSRHPHIIGKFGEYMLYNWLSRSCFEVAIVDHTGIDLVAYNPKTKQRLGITVKSRARNTGKETTPVSIFSYGEGKNDRTKLRNACEYFNCEPWIAIYVETAQCADLYLTSLKNYEGKYGPKKGQTVATWKMSPKYQASYNKDKELKHIRVNFNQDNWIW